MTQIKINDGNLTFENKLGSPKNIHYVLHFSSP